MLMTSEEKLKKNYKNNQIQFLRAVFCISIVLYHYTIRYSELYGTVDLTRVSFLSLLSEFGIISFFILSGLYLIRRSHIKWEKEFVY